MNHERNISVMVHVDDFLIIGNFHEVKWLEMRLRDEFEIKSTYVGRNHQKEVKYLNRTICWTEEGITVESDNKHVQTLLREWGMEDCKGLDTPLPREIDDIKISGESMDAKDATVFRRSAARINFMAQDRPDLSVTSRKLSQFMSDPKLGCDAFIKRVIRYLKSHPRCINHMKWQDEPECITVLIDADWAGDRSSRKSTSGGTISLGDHLIMHWSKLQGNVALSSGEAELNAAVKGISEGLGIKNLCEEFGRNLKLQVGTDASVCNSIILRQGCGKIKHLTTKQLWIQGAVETNDIKILKIPRAINSSDLLTHACSVKDFQDHLKRIGHEGGNPMKAAREQPPPLSRT